MGLTKRKVRTGEGPYKDSYQKKNIGAGKRKLAGEKCPKKK